jgi:hypothetical protein
MQPPAHAGSSLADFSTLKMEAIRSSETSVHRRSTRRHIPEDGILHSHRRKTSNLKNFLMLTHCINLSYVVDHERTSSLLFQFMVSIL